MIKKVIAFVPCYVFYYLGDWVSKLLNSIPEDKNLDWVASVTYKFYNGFMMYSIWWNDFGGLKVWDDTNEQD